MRLKKKTTKPNVLYYLGPKLATIKLVGFSRHDPRLYHITASGFFREVGWLRFTAVRLLSRIVNR